MDFILELTVGLHISLAYSIPNNNNNNNDS